MRLSEREYTALVFWCGLHLVDLSRESKVVKGDGRSQSRISYVAAGAAGK